MTVTRSHSLWNLRNYFKWQNHIFVSNKDVFQALFLLKKVKAPHLWLVSAITPFSLKSLVEWWPQTLFPAKMMLFHARALLSIEKISFLVVFLILRCGKTGNKNKQIVLQHCCKTGWTLMLHVLPPTLNLHVLQQISLVEDFISVKTRNIVFQLVLQQCCKTSCMLLLPVLPKL